MIYLRRNNGQTYIVEESDAIDAGNILETVEGIDVLSPAKVALASLIQTWKAVMYLRMIAFLTVSM